VSDATGDAAADLIVTAELENSAGVGHGLIKTGVGTMRINSVSSYNGPTMVNAGTLLVNGSISGSIATLNAGGTLRGDGSTGPVVLAGGTLAPGDVLRTLNTGDLTLGGGTFAIRISNGTTNDKASVTGSVSFTANTALGLELQRL
jgi:autotransporter-associated beta strand protein